MAVRNVDYHKREKRRKKPQEEGGRRESKWSPQR